MKPIPILIAVAIVFLTGGAAPAPGPMITIRIKPGEMNEAVGKGWIDVTIRVPAAGAQAGAPTLDRFADRLDSDRQAVDSRFTVHDASGPVPRAPHQGNVSNSTPGRRGLPHLADPEKARRILTTLQNESAQFGANITIDGSVGIVRMP